MICEAHKDLNIISESIIILWEKKWVLIRQNFWYNNNFSSRVLFYAFFRSSYVIRSHAKVPEKKRSIFNTCFPFHQHIFLIMPVIQQTCISFIKKDIIFSSLAAEFNCQVIKRQKCMLEKDLQADLATYLLAGYYLRLAKKLEKNAFVI